MEAIVLITAVFLLLAQAVGLLVYYSKRNKYSKSAQNLATFLPATVFVVLTGLGLLLFVGLKVWVEEGGIRAVAQELLTGESPLWLWALGYVLAGGVASTLLSIVIQLGILTFRPPKYQRSRRRHRTSVNDSL